jgi:hypothetical protein
MQGRKSLRNYCGIFGFKLRVCLITLALQKGNVHVNNDLILVHLLCVLVVRDSGFLYRTAPVTCC